MSGVSGFGLARPQIKVTDFILFVRVSRKDLAGRDASSGYRGGHLFVFLVQIDRRTTCPSSMILNLCLAIAKNLKIRIDL